MAAARSVVLSQGVQRHIKRNKDAVDALEALAHEILAGRHIVEESWLATRAVMATASRLDVVLSSNGRAEGLGLMARLARTWGAGRSLGCAQQRTFGCFPDGA